MILSASRRTDIPAFYAEWFMRRIREQYCTMVNPYNRKQVSYVSLRPEDVDALVFWTKNARPILPYLAELDQLGFHYYFQYTINGYGDVFEKHLPSLDQCLATFQELSGLVGPERVIWRYDPIVISNKTDVYYHMKRFSEILQQLKGATRRIVISLVDDYRKASLQLRHLQQEGVQVQMIKAAEDIHELLVFIKKSAVAANLPIYSCAERLSLANYGIAAGNCIDAQLIRELFSVNVRAEKDKSQRPECGCIKSKDIGHYDTCLHGCAYCYAGTLATGRKNALLHELDSPSLLGRYLADSKMK